MQTGWEELHAGEFALLWRGLGLGDPPPWLGIPRFGRTPEIRAEWWASASASLSERGLGTLDHPDQRLAGLLQAVAGADLQLQLQVETPDTALRGIGATGPDGTAAVAKVDTTVRIGPAEKDGLVRAMLEVPPPLGPGSGMAANLPVADFDAGCKAGADEGRGGFIGELGALGVRREESEMLARVLTTRKGGGRLTARALDGSGRWRAAPSMVVWLDAEDGRYALRTDDEWLSVVPADPARLLGMAEEMVAAV